MARNTSIKDAGMDATSVPAFNHGEDVTTPVIVEIRVVNPKKTGTLMVRSIMNPDTGKLMPLIDINGNEKPFAITSGKAKFMLNLTDNYQKQVYDILRVHPYYYKTPNPKLKIIDHEKEADEALTHIENENQARGIIQSLNSIQLANFARLFGLITDNVSEAVMRTRMYDIARETTKNNEGLTGAEKIVFEFNNPNRTLREIIWRARQRNIISIKSGIWYYGQQPLGDSFEKTFLWLKENEDVSVVIQKDANRVVK